MVGCMIVKACMCVSIVPGFVIQQCLIPKLISLMPADCQANKQTHTPHAETTHTHTYFINSQNS